MRDAFARDFVELAMQRDRIRRRQRAVDGALRRNQPDGADARRSMAEPLPDLARERGATVLRSGTGIENMASRELHAKLGFQVSRVEFEKEI